MKERYEKFLETIESPGLKRTAKSLTFIPEYDFENFTPQMLTDIIAQAKPVSERVVSSYLTVLTKYAYFLNRSDIVSIIHKFDRSVFWENYKTIAKKYISNSDFEAFCVRIQTEEDHNILHLTSLVRSIYEGIYSDNLDVLINLKREDIRGNIVTLRPDEDDSYDFEITSRLANDLIELSKIDLWEHTNRFGTITRSPMEGDHIDSCFKMVVRGASERKFAINRHQSLFRSLAQKYIDYPIRPYDLYLSGIMHRIAINLHNEGLNMAEVFEKRSRNKRGFAIIQKELDRSKYKSDLQNFLVTMRGRVEMFEIT